MKKLTFLFLVLLYGPILFAQKGEWIAGGNIGYYGYTQKGSGFESGFRSYYFAPEIAFRFSPTWQFGLGIPYAYTKQYFQLRPDESHLTLQSIGPKVFIRKFFEMSSRFSLFLDLNVTYSWTSLETENVFGFGVQPGEDLKGNIFESTSDFGAAFFLSNRVKVFLAYRLLYFSSYQNDKDIGNQNRYGLNLNPLEKGQIGSFSPRSPSLTLGVFYVLRQSPSMASPPEE